MGGGELPIDLLIEILHRLPAKSLLRFQSVSKSWPRLIRDPNFIARHLRAASDSNSSATIIQFEQGKVHLSRMDTPHSLQSFSCNRDFMVIGSSNGLICLLYQSCRVIISNMLIKDHHMTPIPSILFDSKSCDARSSDVLGFGYDSVSDDYKVVLVKFKYTEPEPKCVGTAIYSLRSDVWSKGKLWDVIGERVGVPSFMNRFSRGVVASCGLHWLGRARARDNGSLMVLIVGFHLNREEFFELSLPDQLSKSRGGLDFHIRIGVLSNCLCISTVAIREEPYNDIWVMKEYGVDASWTKLFRFEPKLERSIFTIVNPLIHFREEDQVLLYEEIHQLFFLYDIRDRQERRCVRNYAIPDFYDHMCPVEAVCSSTIVSLADYRAHWNETLREKRKIDDYSSDCLKAFDDFHHQFNLFLGMSRNL